MRNLLLIKKFSVIYVALILVLGWPAQRVSAAVILLDEACSLHDAIVAANTDSPAGGCPAGAGADTIVLSEDLTLGEELPAIESVIAIEGNGYTISGDKRFGIFDVGQRDFGRNDRDVEIKLTANRLTMQEARGDLGSALYITHGAEVNIYDSRISDNAARRGGAIYNWGQLNITGSVFSNNLAWDSGGAILNHISSLRVIRSAFSDNLAGFKGGAIFSRVPALVRSSSFVRNAALEGGAIFSDEDEFTVANSTFSSNTAVTGGALYLQKSTATLTHLTLYGNEARDGAGLFQDGGSVSLFNSIIGGSIGGGDCVGSFSENYGNLIEDGSCEPAYSGDPLLRPLSGSPAHHPLTASSQANGNGEVDYCERKDQLGNRRQAFYHCDIGAVEWKGETDALDSEAEIAPPREEPTCTLADRIRAANRDEAVGACPAGDGVDTIRIDRDMVLTERLPKISSKIVILGDGHTISGDGHVRIFDISETGHLTIRNLNMARGRHMMHGGAIRLLGGTLKIYNSSIRDSQSGYGGAIYSENGKIEIDGSEFSANSAHFAGGAIEIGDGSHLAISKSRISNNSAQGGGALSVWDASMTLINSMVSHNAAGYGGAIVSSGGHPDSELAPEDNTLAIIESTIIQNSATYFGGAINASAKKLLITGSVLRDNKAGAAGGAIIMVYGGLLAENSSFVNNVAGQDGGAIYSESADNMDFANSTFSGNSAEVGGALVVSDSSTLTHVTIANNVANEAGGISMFSGVALRNSVVADNSGGDCGFRSEYVQRIDFVASHIGDGSCDADLSGDPMLGALDEEGGFRALLQGSPAIDAADPRFCTETDQLGSPRPVGAGCDLGAVEFMGE